MSGGHVEGLAPYPEPRWGKLDAPRLGTWLFVVSEAMLFAGLVSAFLVLRAGAPAFGGPGEHLALGDGLVATGALVASSVCLAVANARARARGPRAAVPLAALGLVLGVVFLGLAAREWAVVLHEGVTPRTSLYWSAFFVLTGVHALHVAGGVLWLACGLVAARAGRARALALASTYWHFVDLVWIVLLVLLYPW